MNKTTRCLVTFALVLFACNEKSEPAPEPGQAAPAPAPAAAPPPAAPAQPPVAAEQPPVPAGAKVMFFEPADGAKIGGPLENGKVAVQR